MRRSPVQVRQGAFFYFPETFPGVFLQTIIKIRIIIKKRKTEALIKIHKKSNPCVIKHTNMMFLIRPKTEKQKFTIKENVMSEQVKMPVRHFLRRDYLHIFFYSKFLLFVCFCLFINHT